MLADPRAEPRSSTRFAAQWLRLQDLHKVEPDALSFPYFDESLAAGDGARNGTRSSTHVVRADRPATRTAHRRLHLRERAAGAALRHRRRQRTGVPEGVISRRPAPRPSGTRQHSDADLARQPDVARAAREVGARSAVRRPPPPPPPDVPDLEKTEGGRRTASSGPSPNSWRCIGRVRSCSSCHNVIDPIGLALDQFDVTGAWRIKDRGVPVKHRGRAVRRHEDQRRSRPARGHPVAVGRRADAFHGDADGVCHRPAGGVLRHADDKKDRPGCGEERVPVSSVILGVAESAAFRTAKADGEVRA